MNPGADLAADRRPASWSRGEREWTPGFSDWLGDRFLDFDLTTATSLERLQFRREFGDSAVFEAALRERVEHLQHLQHPSIETVRSVVRVPGKGLILESKHTAGRRLSEAFPQDRGAVVALDLIRQLVPMLVLLHKTGDDVAHGAIGAERIVVTRDGRLVLAEHVLGSALAAQQIPAMKWRALGLPTDREVAAPDARGDLIQLGFLALSLMIGRRLSPVDYPGNIERLVSESALLPSGRSPEAAWLRRWIERALQVGPNPFGSAQEALETVGELSEAGTVQPVTADRLIRSIPTHAATLAAAAAPVIPTPPVLDRSVDARPKIPVASTPMPAPVPVPQRPPADRVAPARKAGTTRWLAPGLAALAIAEAAVIVALVATRPASISADAREPVAAPVTTQARGTSSPSSVRATPPDPGAAIAPKPVPTEAAQPESRPLADASATDRPPLPAERFGGVRVSSALQLQVYEGDKLLGSTLAPIALTEGAHKLDFVNEALAFRAHATPVVKAGQMTPLTIPVPNGSLSINALPWADVLIDGKPAGQTPLANLSVTIGEHEIVFRHPQFGEQRQTAVVKADAPARVSLTFPRAGGGQ